VCLKIIMVGNAGSEALYRNGALRTTCSGRGLTASVNDERRHRSALPPGTEARAPQKANQLDEDTLPLMLYLTEWKRMQDACCPFTKCVLAIGSILAKTTWVGARSSGLNTRQRIAFTHVSCHPITRETRAGDDRLGLPS
jgi:hypothetical protein